MFGFDKNDLQRFAVSMIGGLALSAACIVSAVAPQRADAVRAHIVPIVAE